MERVHLPKRLDRASSCHHELLCASRVDFDEIGDIVDTIFVWDPNSVLNSSVLLNVLASKSWEILDLIFCSMNQFRIKNHVIHFGSISLSFRNLVQEKSTERVTSLEWASQELVLFRFVLMLVSDSAHGGDWHDLEETVVFEIVHLIIKSNKFWLVLSFSKIDQIKTPNSN